MNSFEDLEDFELKLMIEPEIANSRESMTMILIPRVVTYKPKPEGPKKRAIKKILKADNAVLSPMPIVTKDASFIV